MDILYGEGQYTQGDIRCHGKIILDQYKLYLKGPEGDLTQSYVSLDKIIKIKRGRAYIALDVALSPVNRYLAVIKMEKVNVKDLVETIVKRMGLKKRFLFNEWVACDP